MFNAHVQLIPLIAGRLPLPVVLLNGGALGRGGGFSDGCVAVSARRDTHILGTVRLTTKSN